MRNIADITPKLKDIRIADIIPNDSYLRSNADIPKLSAIGCLENGKRYHWQNILKWDDNND